MSTVSTGSYVTGQDNTITNITDGLAVDSGEELRLGVTVTP